MKNLFYCAIACVALSVSGFANSSARKVRAVKTFNAIIFKNSPCQDMAIDLYICSGSDSVSYFQQLWSRCK